MLSPNLAYSWTVSLQTDKGHIVSPSLFQKLFIRYRSSVRSMKHRINNLVSHLLLVWEVMQGKGGMDSVGQDNPKVQQTPNIDALQGFSPTEMNTSINKKEPEVQENIHRQLTSDEISYTIYLFRINPCCPRIVTLMFSCFFHQSFGIPDPARVEGVPLGKVSVTLLDSPVKRAFEFQGSSDE